MIRKLLFVIIGICLTMIDVEAQEFYEAKGKISIFGKKTDGKKDKNGKIIYKDEELDKDELGLFVYRFDNSVAKNNFVKMVQQKYKENPYGRLSFRQYDHVETKENGHFTVPDAVDGMFLVFINPLYGPESSEPLCIEHELKPNNRNIAFRVSDKTIILRDAEKKVKLKRKAGADIGKTRAYGRNLTFNIRVHIPKDQLPDNSRIILSPVAVDCQTGDTVDFVQSFVSDASEYHDLQNKRMAFDASNNDPIYKNSKYQDLDSLSEDEEEIFIEYTIEYERPIASHTYRCSGTMVIEDYTHKLGESSYVFGTCNIAEPFRFLNIKGAKIPLTDEFYEIPKQELREEKADVLLQFEQGSAKLIANERNTILKDNLRKQLERHGQNIVFMTVTGGASPEGSVARNVTLAKERANVALNLVKSFSPGTNSKIETHTFTWSDVVDSLVAKKDTIRSSFIKSFVDARKDPPWSELKGDSVVNSILTNMRMMHFDYKYRDSKPLEPEEALARFMELRKTKWNQRKWNGRPFSFSKGDYYNILKLTEEDPKLFREVIEEIYDKEFKGIDRTNHASTPLYVFVANRIANYSLDEDIPDTTILLPFLDDQNLILNSQRAINMLGDKKTLNRYENVATQAAMALKLTCLDYSDFWFNIIGDNNSQQTISLLKSIVKTILNWDNPETSQEERDAAIEKADLVMNEDPINNAVIKTELMEEFKYSEKEAIEALEQLNDEEPRKWYLLAIHQAKKAGKREDAVDGAFNDYGTGFRPKTAEEIDLLSPNDAIKYDELEALYKKAKADYESKNGNDGLDTIPTFLAYLQHSFDLTHGKFKKFYASEALINAGIYEKYPYNPRMQKYYRRKFEMIYAARLEKKKKQAQAQTSEVANEKQNQNQQEQQ